MLTKIINKNDYNSIIVKLRLFFLALDLSLEMNISFYKDDSIHKILDDEDKFKLIYQCPQIIYSTIISGTLFSNSDMSAN